MVRYERSVAVSCALSCANALPTGSTPAPAQTVLLCCFWTAPSCAPLLLSSVSLARAECNLGCTMCEDHAAESDRKRAIGKGEIEKRLNMDPELIRRIITECVPVGLVQVRSSTHRPAPSVPDSASMGLPKPLPPLNTPSDHAPPLETRYNSTCSGTLTSLFIAAGHSYHDGRADYLGALQCVPLLWWHTPRRRHGQPDNQWCGTDTVGRAPRPAQMRRPAAMPRSALDRSSVNRPGR